ncbi:MAG: hypothetical protein N4A49_09360 [Marinifilaceae bacterium]|jgi:hypothetical protein|nr:hypothetical protein [Marinifilaceae bacterium]
MKNTLLALFLILGLNCFSQTRTYQFEDGMCYFTGKYDSNKYTKEQLDNTRINLVGDFFNAGSTTAWDQNGVNNLDPVKFRNNIINRIKFLKTTDFVKGKFWEDIKTRKIHYLKELLKFGSATIYSYKNIDSLKNYKTNDKILNYYRNAIISGEEQIIEALKHLTQEQIKAGGWAENLNKELNEILNSNDRYNKAKLQVIMFGWWNRGNHLLPHLSDDLNRGKEFNKLFISHDYECDEP